VGESLLGMVKWRVVVDDRKEKVSLIAEGNLMTEECSEAEGKTRTSGQKKNSGSQGDYTERRNLLSADRLLRLLGVKLERLGWGTSAEEILYVHQLNSP